MHSKSIMRLSRLLTISVLPLLLIGCWGNGDGPSGVPDAPREEQGLLVNSNVDNAEWFTSGGESGFTDNGAFPYFKRDTIEFFVGSILLGVPGVTVDAAEILTPVELTGSSNPTNQFATNMFVFLQTIDTNSPNSADGIQISAATLTAFTDQSLNFNSDSLTFTNDFQTLLDAVLPGTKIVSEEDALRSFCENTYLPRGGENTFGYPFPGCEFASDTELLTNRSFESPDASGGDTVCSNSWACFNPVFTTSNLFDSGNQSPPAAEGTQVLKMFGPFFKDGAAGANQDFTPVPNAEYSASVMVQNWTEAFPTPDPLDPSNLADLQLIFSSDGNFIDGVGETAFEVFGSSDPALTQFTYLPPNEWIMLSVTGVAPENTVAGRFQILHIQTGAEVTGGNVFYDEASLIGPPLGPPGDLEYELVWSDEFDGPTLSASNWNVEEGYGVWSDPFANNEWQKYTSLPENISIVKDPGDANNGYLAITALCTDPDSGVTAAPLATGGVALQAAGDNLLTNGTFEAGTGPGAFGWDTFEAVNTVPTDDGLGNFAPVSHDTPGTNSLKMFGPFQLNPNAAGAFQVVDGISPGDFQAEAWAMNWQPDTFTNIGILQLSFWDGAGATGNNLSTIEVTVDSTTNPLDQDISLAPQDGAEISDWTQLLINATAPAGTVSAKVFLLHIQTDPISGGSLFWDDVSLTQAVVEPSDCVAGKRDGSVTSARINSLGKKSDIRYGKIVGRIKPAVGAAAWGAFWMLGSNNPEIGWPRSGEIDITEIFPSTSNDRTTHSTLHWCPKTDPQELNDNCFADRAQEGGQLDTGSSLGNDFHEFEVVWTPERFVFYIDGQQVYSKLIDPNTMEEFNEDFYMILNLAIGGTLGSGNQDPDPNGANWELPQTMLVDYVRVYQAIQ